MCLEFRMIPTWLPPGFAKFGMLLARSVLLQPPTLTPMFGDKWAGALKFCFRPLPTSALLSTMDSSSPFSIISLSESLVECILRNHQIVLVARLKCP